MARQVLPIVGAVVGAYFGNPQLGYAIGSIIGNAVDPEVIQGPKIGDAGVQTSAEGVPRPIVFGTAPVVGNVIMRGNRVIRKVEEGGKGGPVTESERVSWTFAIRIAEGPIAAVTRIWEEEKLVYDITPGSAIQAESAKYAQKFRLYLGGESQLPDPDLEVIKGAGNVNAYRGTAYIVFPNFDLTDYRERIPTYRFEVASVAADDSTTVDTIVISDNSRWIVSSTGVDWDSESKTGPSTNYLMAGPDRYVRWNSNQAYYLVPGTEVWVPSIGFPVGSGGTRNGVYFKGDYVIAGGLYGILVSTDDAVSFVELPYPDYPRANLIACNDSLLVAASHYDGRLSLASSPSGPWSFGATHGVDIGNGGCLVWGGGRFKFGGKKSGNTPYIVSTADGETIEPDTLPEFDSATRITAMAYGDGVWVAGTDSGEMLFSHGASWSLSTNALPAEVTGIAFNGAVFIVTTRSSGAGSGDSGIFTTLDGDTFVRRRSGDGPYYDVASLRYDQASMVGEPVPLSSIVSALHGRVKQPASKYNVSELADMVDGVVFAGDYTVADGIRSLLTPYFADASEYDAGSGWKIHYVKRGKPVVKTLTEDDLVDEPEKSMRESAIEFPAKLHMFFQNPLIGYAPAKATSFRSSPDLRVVGEASVQVPVTISDVDEAAKISNKLHKVSWAEAEGDTVLTVSDEHLDLVAGDNVGLALRGSVRRLRITKIEDNPGTRKITFRVDRQSAYTSNVTGIPLPAPTPPPPSIVGQTVFEFLDISALLDTDDALIYYDAAAGTTEAWYGSSVQRQDAIGDFSEVNRFNRGSAIGVLLAEVSAASEHYTDTTNALRVQFYRDPELDSLTDEQFLSEAGALAVEKPDGTWELVQYRDAEQDSDGNYTLTTLHRGRLNSGASAHEAGARVVVLATVQKVPAVTAMIDTDLTHRAVSFGESPENAVEYTDAYTAKSQSEWPVANLLLDRDGDGVIATAVPRHRFGTEDNPVRSINWTGYRWTATDGTNTVTRETTTDSTTFDATGWASPVTVTVAQLNRYTGAGPNVSEEIA